MRVASIMCMRARETINARGKPMMYFFARIAFRIGELALVGPCTAAVAVKMLTPNTPEANTATGHSPTDTATTVMTLST